MKFLILFIALRAVMFAAVWTVPAENLPSGGWVPGTNVGIPGGIPDRSASRIDVTLSPYFADNTGATDAQPAIQDAINAASPGDEIYLPAGTYKCDAFFGLSDKTEVTLGGAGATTVINFTTSRGTGFSFGRSNDLTSAHTVTAGVTAGSTTVTIDDTTDFTVGRLMRLNFANETSTPIVSVLGYSSVQAQNVRLLSKTSTTLTFEPALYATFSGTTTAQAYGFTTKLVGIQNLTINANLLVQKVIQFLRVDRGFVKNVTCNEALNSHVYIDDGLNMEVRDSWFNITGAGGSPPNAAGLNIFLTSGSLFENNILFRAFPLIEVNTGSLGNAFLFNYTYDSRAGIAVTDGHTPHNRFNLYEGNVVSSFQMDGYYGSSSHGTVFRNRLTARPVIETNGFAVVLERFSRNYVFVGNLLATGAGDSVYSMGNPNLGNGSYYGTADFNAGSTWVHLKLDGTTPFSGPLTTRTDDETGTFTLTGTGVPNEFEYPYSDAGNANLNVYWSGGARFNMRYVSDSGSTITLGQSPQGNTGGDVLPTAGTAVTIWAGALGFQELDLGVEASVTKLWNWNAIDNGIPMDEEPGVGQTFPDSIAYPSGPPSWWSGDWPAYDPDSPATRDEARIPANVRYNGTEGISVADVTNLNVGTIRLAP